jgi:addiction module RelE/StbE family toxin
MEVVWRPSALDDLEQARHHVAEHNPRAAERLWHRILTVIQRLAILPGLGRPGRVEGTRELVVPRTPYIVAYTVIGDEVMILSIIHSSRQWPDSF